VKCLFAIDPIPTVYQEDPRETRLNPARGVLGVGGAFLLAASLAIVMYQLCIG
jgi:hypothetical protein